MKSKDFRIKDNPYLSAELINCVMEVTGVELLEAQSIIRYNIITPLQLSIITSRSISAIQNLMRPRETGFGITIYLQKVYPFKAKDEMGPVFVEFDQNCYDYIITTFKSQNGKNTGRIKGTTDD